MTGHLARLAWPLFETASVEHFLRVVRDRARLQPYVGSAADAHAAIAKSAA